jgi:hypothetical protein
LHTLKCEWCNEVKNLTTHHIKNRLGEKEVVWKYGKFIQNTMRVCRSCHNEIEIMYELETKVVLKESFKKEDTLEGILHNMYFRMSNIDTKAKRCDTSHWIERKIVRTHRKLNNDKSCHIGLYNTIERNRLPYRTTIMTLAIALNDLKHIYMEK